MISAVWSGMISHHSSGSSQGKSESLAGTMIGSRIPPGASFVSPVQIVWIAPIVCLYTIMCRTPLFQPAVCRPHTGYR